MKKLYILLIVAISSVTLLQAQEDAQAYFESIFECGMEENNAYHISSMAASSENGYQFTPKGDLRALVVYVDWDFDAFGNIPAYNQANASEYPMEEWDFGNQFPDNNVDSNGDIIWGHQNFNEFSPLGNPASDANENLSEFYYHMSDGKFRMYFETLKDANGNATNVVVDPVNPATGVFYTSQSQIDTQVFAKISSDYPQDWSRFDIRPDMPFFNNDASETLDCLSQDPPTCNSNNVIDYIVMIYRNTKYQWGAKAPIQGAGTGSSGVSTKPLDNGYSTGPRASWHNFYKGRYSLMKLLIHEISHGYYSAPHYAAANDVHGKYFHSNYLSNNMTGIGLMATTSNAWERWFSGWTEITHDVDNSIIAPTTYTLKGFHEDSESMRVKLPFAEDQYIWFENRKSSTNPFYDILTFTQDSNGSTIPKQGSGLYAYVERVAGSRADVSGVYGRGANGLKMINGCGNFDYEFDGYYPAPYYWPSSPDVMRVNNSGVNAYNGQHTASFFRHDYDDSGVIDHSSNAGGFGTNEGDELMEVGQQVVWGQRAPYVKLPMQKLSAFTNPPLSNFQEISTGLNTLSPMVLHSLSISPVTVGYNSDINITVDYNDGHIQDDFRMTGNVYLPGGESITLNHAKELLLNKTKSPSKNQAVDGSFSDPTVFIAADNGSFTAINNSTIILDEGTTMIYESGSTLNMQSTAKLYVRNGSLLCLKTGANINLSPGAQIIVEDGSIEIGLGINIAANVIYTSDYIAPVQHYTTLDWCGPTSNPEHKHSTDGTYIDSFSCGTLSIDLAPTAVVKLTSETEIEITGILNIPAGAYFETEILYWADDCDKTFFFGTNGVPVPFTGSGGDEERFEQKDKPPFEVAILPNPSNGNFEVQIDKTLASFTYTLFDFSGNVVLENTKQNTNLFSIAQSGLLTGIYILEVVSNNDVVSVKVIVNK